MAITDIILSELSTPCVPLIVPPALQMRQARCYCAAAVVY
jgi:hypothetical protein